MKQNAKLIQAIDYYLTFWSHFYFIIKFICHLPLIFNAASTLKQENFL